MVPPSLYVYEKFFRQTAGHLFHTLVPVAVTVLILTTVSTATTSVEHKLSTVINGLSPEQKQQVRAYIGTPQISVISELPNLTNNIAEKAEKSLSALGYYNALAQAKHSSFKDHSIIELNIDAGIPTRIKNISLTIDGGAKENTEFQRMLNLLPIKTGAIFSHEDYERSKDMLYNTAQNLGFFNAKFLRSQILVTRKSHTAEIILHFDSGDRHQIREVKYNTSLFDDVFLQRWQPFETNIPYRASHALELTQNLQNSGYFKFVQVRPEAELTKDNSLPLIVDLEPAKENIMSLGIGYATDTGIRVKGSWLRPHHNEKGHALNGNTSLSRLRQELSASYQIPHRVSPATGKYTLDFGLLNHRTDDTYSQLRTMNVSDQRLTKRGWYRDVFIRWENENTDDKSDRINLILPGFSFSRTKSTGGLHPDKGTFFSFKLLGASKTLLSDINMFRVTASAKKLNSWNRKHYLIARTDLGILKTDNFDRVPISHRYFAGGDSSIRGYAYQSISPLNSDNESTGGRFLTTFSAEYNYYIRDRWALAAFVDAGRAFTNSDAPYKIGVGGGIRWLSPVGPLRIDVGAGVSEDDNPLRLHLAIGPAL